MTKFVIRFICNYYRDLLLFFYFFIFFISSILSQIIEAKIAIPTITPNIVIDTNQWVDTRWDVVKPLFYEIANILNKEIENPRLTKIQIFKSDFVKQEGSYPETAELKGFTMILLSASENYWSQFAYQFSHEYLHYLVYRPFNLTGDKFAWFEETIAELASLYSLDKLSKAKRYTIYESYRPYFNTYLVSKRNSVTPINIPIGEFIRINEDQLETKRDLREINSQIAFELLLFFNKSPYLWNAVTYLKHIDESKLNNFKEYLGSWLSVVPEENKVDLELLINKLLEGY